MSAPRALRPLTCPLHGTQLIEASAGTGKTFTITTLYLRLLLGEDGHKPLRVDQILVVTFTRAATAELRDKLRDRVRRAVLAFERLAAGFAVPGCGDETIDGWACARVADGADAAADRDHLMRALRDFDEAAVFTIHGFAQRMLADHAFESGVAFDTEFIADESALLREVVEDYWAHWTYDAPAPFLRHLATRKLDVERLVKLAWRGTSMPRLIVLPTPAEDEPTGLEARKGLEERLAEPIAAWREAHARAAGLWWAQRTEIAALLAAAKPGLYKAPYHAWLDGPWRAGVDRAMAPEARPPLALHYAKWNLLCADKLAQKTRKGQPQPEHAFFDACQALHEAEDALAAGLDGEVDRLQRGLIDYVRHESERRKKRWNKQSFGDLLLRLDDAMLAGDAASEALVAGIRDQFPVALIDEFQDTDPVQYEIFKSLYIAGDEDADPPPGTALFLIGDPKQAIYGFRGADIFAYLKAKEHTPPGQRWTLDKNWRSDPGMVAAVNSVFQHPSSPFALEGLDFIPVQAQPSARDRLRGGPPEARAALRLLLPRREAFGVDPGKRLTKGRELHRVGEAVAADIVRLLRSGVRIADGEEAADARPVMPGDIAILVRTNREARDLQTALRAAGVPSALQGEASVLDSEDAEDATRLLAAMAEPGDAAALRAALATALLGSDARDLDAMRGDEARWDAAATALRAWHDTWQKQGFVQAFRRVLLEARTAERLLAREDGERRLTNLLHIGELLHAAAAELRLGPQGLLQWLQLVRADERARGELIGEAAQLRLESDEAAVRLVTVHKAKGLEYPIVYCPTLWGPSKLAGDDKDWPRCHDEAQRLVLDLGSPDHEAHLAAAAREQLAEDLRLLYVALTRARHQCVLVYGAFTGVEDGALAYLLHAEGRSGAVDEEGPVARGPDAAAAANPEPDVDSARAAIRARVQDRIGRGDEALAEDLLRLVARGKAAAAGGGGTVANERKAAASARPVIAIENLPPAVGARWQPPAEAQPRLAARRVGRAIRRAWRVASFTSLAAGHGDDAADPAAKPGQDRDAIDTAGAEEVAGGVGAGSESELVGMLSATEPSSIATTREQADDDIVPLADFPAGARAGQLLHDVLESTDFTAGGGFRSLEEQVPRHLRAHGLSAATWREPLAAALREVLDTDLGGQARTLHQIDWQDRMHEMAFMAPLRERGPTATPAAVAAALAEHGGPGLPPGYADRLARRSWGSLRGALHGFIDLIFRAPTQGSGRETDRSQADGWRWFLVDYKSNRIGPTRGDYRPARLAEEMARHDYVLQYHLYVLALHRYLRHRLPGYDYERHFGGVRYLFLRGMSPGDGAQRGVFVDRPPLALVDRLEALFFGEREVVVAFTPERSAPDERRPAS